MKLRRLANLSVFILGLIIMAPGLVAQTADKYGENPDLCKRNLSLYKESLNVKDYAGAMGPWRWCIDNCPQATKNIYIDGVKIMTYNIQKNKDEAIKDLYLDTLMMVYEQRIQYFAKEAFVKGRMGVDLLKFKPSEVEKAYGLLKYSLTNSGKKVEDAVAITYMQSCVYLFKSGVIGASDVLEDFAAIMEALDGRYQYYVSKGNDKKSEKTQTAIQSVENHFMDSGAAGCAELVSYFTPKFNEAPGDIELLKKITKLLRKSDCTDENLFFDAAKQLYKLEPSSEAAYNIAKLALKRNDFQESSKYYLEAIEKEEVGIVKANYYYELGLITYSQLGNSELARQYAYSALKADPASGKPYMLIGNIYASSAKNCGEDEFQQRAVYWAAIDKYKKAKAVDSSLKDDADKAINIWKEHLPGKENGFFYGVSEGNTYKVGCWINETTTARYYK